MNITCSVSETHTHTHTAMNITRSVSETHTHTHSHEHYLLCVRNTHTLSPLSLNGSRRWLGLVIKAVYKELINPPSQPLRLHASHTLSNEAPLTHMGQERMPTTSLSLTHTHTHTSGLQDGVLRLCVVLDHLADE